MIKLLQQITNIIQDGMPLTYKRNPSEMDQSLILEYFPKENEERNNIEHFFATEDSDYVSTLDEQSLQCLFDILKEYKDIFSEKNKELIQQELDIQNQKQEDIAIANKKEELALEEIWRFMKKIVDDIEIGAENPMKWYLKLKKIESWCKNFLKMINDAAYMDFENWDKNDLPYGFTWMIQNRLTIKYTDNLDYDLKKSELKDMEDIMKDVVRQNEKWQTVNNPDGEVYDVPSYSYKASLVVKQWVKKG